jgi:hypothetical protein
VKAKNSTSANCSAYCATLDPMTVFKPGANELSPMSKSPDQRLCRRVDSH